MRNLFLKSNGIVYCHRHQILVFKQLGSHFKHFYTHPVLIFIAD